MTWFRGVCLFLLKGVLNGETLVISWFDAAVPKGQVISAVSSSRTLYSKQASFLWLYILMVVVQLVSRIWLFCDAIDCSSPGASVHEISQVGYWSGQLFPFLADLPDLEIELSSPALAGGSFTTEPPGKAHRQGKLRQLSQLFVMLRNQSEMTLGYSLVSSHFILIIIF